MKKIVYLIFLLISLTLFSQASADDTELYVLTQALQEVPPDALILLDLSGSMNWTPAGSTLYVSGSSVCSSHTYDGDDVAYYSKSGTGHTYDCKDIPYSGSRPRYGDSTCSDTEGFHKTSGGAHTTDCSRVAIAKRALFKFLDTDDDGVTPVGNPDNKINQKDLDYLKIRMGYMRFYNCGDPETVNSTSYTSGCNKVIWPNPNSSFENSSYSKVYCNDAGGVSECTPTSSASDSISGESATGGTPVAAALEEALYYLDFTKNPTVDVNAACRQKFVILITDGADTFACSGDGSESQKTQYKRRRETVARARALANAGYYVFVVGFGSNMPYYLQNTLNWAGYYGRTKNTSQTQSITQAYTIPFGQIYPQDISACTNSSTTQHTDGHYYATANDPGEAGISGYAFIAQSSDDLDAAIAAIRSFIVSLIAESTSYVAPVVPISQYQSTSSENRMYLGMFKPTPFTMWEGNIKKYGIASSTTSTITVGDVIDKNNNLVMTADNKIKEDSNDPTNPDKNAWSHWSLSPDGGNVERGGVGGLLQNRDFATDPRSIYTYTSTNSNLKDSSNAFTTTNTAITPALLGVSTTTDKNNIINFIHGLDAWDWDSDTNTTEKRAWILGAFIHSRPVVIHYGTYDVIYVGANDGMLHAFKNTNGVGPDDGKELWGFIPPDLLPKLKDFNDTVAPSLKIFVDGSPKAYQGSSQKILIFGERRGGSAYYALDVSDPDNPTFQWSIDPSRANYGELGQTWSTPKLGLIKNGTGTKVVAFIGGGYDTNQDSASPSSDTHGRAVYVVDITNGNQIWKYSFSGDSNMKYCIPSDITPVDVNGDGFVERLYVGDVGGQIWRFDLCSSETGSCIPDMADTTKWKGSIVFKGSGKIFYPPDVTLENNIGSGTYSMLFFGTGDREKPKDTGSGNRLYAIKDYDVFKGTKTESDLVDVTLTTSIDTTTRTALIAKYGWYILLNQSAGSGTNPNPGEKCSGPAVVLGGAAYYTTFTPTPVTTGTVCAIRTGSGSVYVVQYQTGMAVFDLDNNSLINSNDKSEDVGAGLPSGVIIAIIGDTVIGYGGVAGGVFSPQLTVHKSVVPVGWRLLF